MPAEPVVIDQARYYTHERCPATVSGLLLIGGWAGCPYCGHRGPWTLVEMGEPGKVSRTILERQAGSPQRDTTPRPGDY